LHEVPAHAGADDAAASRAPADDEGLIRFSLLREAAALVSARGGARRPARSPAGTAGAARTRRRWRWPTRWATAHGPACRTPRRCWWPCLAFTASHDDRGIAAFWPAT